MRTKGFPPCAPFQKTFAFFILVKLSGLTRSNFKIAVFIKTAAFLFNLILTPFAAVTRKKTKLYVAEKMFAVRFKRIIAVSYKVRSF